MVSLLLLTLWPALPAEALETSRPTNVAVLPLVLRGADVPALVGKPASSLTALACREGRLKPILFQVDEINEEERVVSFYGSKGRVAPDATPGVIDENDELIVMLRDLGPACDAEQVSRLRGEAVALEITAPYLPAPALLYLLVSERGYVPPERYLHYDPAAQTVKSAGYTWGYDPARPFFYDRVGFGEYQEEPHKNVFDRIKTRFVANALGSLVQITITEDDIKGVLEGVRDGPVRVTREIRARVNVLPGLTVVALVSYQHYDRGRVAKVRVELPRPAALFTSSMDVSFVHDFVDLRGIRVSTAMTPEGVLVDGVMNAREDAIAYGDRVWSLMSGLGINEVLVLQYDRGMQLTPALNFVDSESAANPPERVPGAMPAVGFQFNWRNLEAGRHRFDVSMFALPAFPEGGGDGFYDVFSAPVRVRVVPAPAQPM